MVCDLAHEVMGGVDLDPASCAAFNRFVRADCIYTKQDNGFLLPWHGRVFHNPPGGWNDEEGREVHKATKTRRPCTETGACGLPPGHVHKGMGSSAKRWWFCLERQWRAGHVTEAVFVCFDLGLLQTTQNGTPDGAYVPLDFAVCYPSERLEYVDENGESAGAPPHASCIVYLPGEGGPGKFKAVFSALGKVVVPS
jgi:hypothetical protein